MSFTELAKNIGENINKLREDLDDFINDVDTANINDEDFEALASVRKSLDYGIRSFSEQKDALEEKFQKILDNNNDNQSAGTRRRKHKHIKKRHRTKRRH